MTGLDALGAPEGGNPASDILLQDAYEGTMMPEIRRRHWMATENDDDAFISSAVGVTASMGKGLADAGLGLARGLAWLGTAGQYDTSQMPQSLYDLLPEEGANRLASRIARANIGGETEIMGANVGSAGEMTGQMLAILGGGGLPGGAAGKGVDFVSKAAKPFTLPGQAIKALGFPGQAAGARLAAIPQVAAWTRTAKVLPEVLGGASGFGLYNFVTQDGDLGDRAGAMLHGAAAGGALSVLGKVATAAEAKLLDRMVTPEQIVGLTKLGKIAKAGQYQGGYVALNNAVMKTLGRSASTMIEGTGFAMLDQRFWDAALAGDMEKAVGTYVESLPAALLARTGRMDAWKQFRRDAPDLNDLNLRREIIATRRAQADQEVKVEPQEPQGERGVAVKEREIVDGKPVAPERDGLPLRQHRVGETPMIPELKPGQPQLTGGQNEITVKGADQSVIDYQSGRPDPMNEAARPLLHSGWEIPEGLPAKGTVDLAFGNSAITFTERGISVPREVFEAVRGTEFGIKTDTVEMQGPIAEEFARDLAAVSMMRRMSGELRFEGEAWAGGPWKSGDGRLLTVGLDGEVYSKSYPAKEGEAWALTKGEKPDVSMEPQTPEQARWRDFAEALRGTATPNPGLDLIETSVATAINGNPQSPSVIELNRFLQSVSPDHLSQMLTPANLEHVGLVMGKIGSGHLRAEDAGMALQEALSVAPEVGGGAPPAEPPGGGKRMAEPGDPEAGAVDLSVAKGVGELAKRGVEKVKEGLDYAYESRANEIAQVVPHDTFPAEYRTVLSNRRVMRGEAMALAAPAKKAVKKLGGAWRGKMESALPASRKVSKDAGASSKDAAPLVSTNPQTARWELLADRKIEPANAKEREFQESWQEAELFLWNKAREAGTVRVQEGGAGPLPERSQSVTPRYVGRDAQKVIDNPSARQAWHETLVALNPGKTSVESLEARYNPPVAKAKTKVETPDIGTAIEHMRSLPNVPHTFTHEGNTYEMRLADPESVMSRLIEEQSAQIATNRMWGQDLTAKHRGQVMQSGDPAAIKAMERRGVADRVARVMHDAKAGGGNFQRISSQQLEGMLGEAVQIAQGGSPGKINPLLAAARDLDSVPRAFMTIKAPIYDLPEMITQPVLYSGIRRTLKALNEVFGDLKPHESIAHYERMGAISSKMTSLMFEEARGIAGTASKWAGKVGELSERLKGAIVAATAEQHLKDWKEGKQSSSQSWLSLGRMRKDAALVSEMEMTPQEQTDLLTGRFSEELGNKFRNEYVQMVTARAEVGEGSRFADNPNWMAALRFQRLMTKRTAQVVHRVKIALEANKKHGAHSKAALRSWGRVWSMVGMHTAVTGPIALSLMIGLQQLMRGAPEETFERLHREIVMQPVEATKQSFMRQVVGGPLATATDTLGAATAERAARGVLAPVDQGVGIWRVFKAAMSGDYEAGALMGELAKQLHYIPAQADATRLKPRAEEWWTAATTGENLSLAGAAISDRDLALEFLRGPGKDAGLMGIEKARSQFEPGKTTAFYDSVNAAMKQFWRGAANGGPEEGLKRATSVFKELIEEQGESPKSISSWLRSQRTVSIIGNDKIAEFYDYVGESKLDGIVARDDMIAQLATAVGRMDGQPLPDWAERVEDLRKTAALGVGDWDPVMKDTIASVAKEIELNVGVRGVDLSRLEEVARIVASSDRLISKVFPGSDGEYLAGLDSVSDAPKRLRFVTFMLRERAQNAAIRRMDAAQKAKTK